jgi:hypothetical protein
MLVIKLACFASDSHTPFVKTLFHKEYSCSCRGICGTPAPNRQAIPPGDRPGPDSRADTARQAARGVRIAGLVNNFAGRSAAAYHPYAHPFAAAPMPPSPTPARRCRPARPARAASQKPGESIFVMPDRKLRLHAADAVHGRSGRRGGPEGFPVLRRFSIFRVKS